MGCAAREWDGRRPVRQRVFEEKSVEIAEIFLEFPEQPGVGRRWSALDGESELRFLLLELGLEGPGGRRGWYSPRCRGDS